MFESTAWIVLALFTIGCLFAAWYTWADKTLIYHAHKPHRNWLKIAWCFYWALVMEKDNGRTYPD